MGLSREADQGPKGSMGLARLIIIQRFLTAILDAIWNWGFVLFCEPFLYRTTHETRLCLTKPFLYFVYIMVLFSIPPFSRYLADAFARHHDNGKRQNWRKTRDQMNWCFLNILEFYHYQQCSKFMMFDYLNLCFCFFEYYKYKSYNLV